MTTISPPTPKNLETLLQQIPQQPQRQDSTNAQLADLHTFAIRLGLYDAVDAIRVAIDADAALATHRKGVLDNE